MNRVLIVRTSAIGDLVFASPFAAALRSSHPNAFIAWLAEPSTGQVVANDPTINRVIPWPRREWFTLAKSGRLLALSRAVRDFRRELHACNFDTAIDLQGLLKSGLLTRLSGAPRRVGLDSREGSRALMTEVHTSPPGGGHIGSEYRFLAERLGLPVDNFLPTLRTTPDADNRALNLLGPKGIGPGTYAILAPFTTRPQKHWFNDAWRSLAPRLRSEFGLAPVMLGSPADSPAATTLLGDRTGILNLVGHTTLDEAMSLVKHAGLVVGVDTGLTHMGTGFARPTVALFGSTCPYRDAGRATSRVIWLGLSCSPCRRHPTCNGDFTCLRDITADRVMDEARLALSGGAA